MEYKTIYADPPWPEYGSGKSIRGAQRHYNLMSINDIINFMKKISIAENAHLYLWCTNRFLPDGLKVIDALDFKYITNRVWIKDTIGLGQYFRGMHELLLFAKKGELPFKNRINNQRSKCKIKSIILCKKKGHSIKPNIYIDIEKTSYPPYLEVFSRNNIDGWDCIGLETPRTKQKRLEI